MLRGWDVASLTKDKLFAVLFSHSLHVGCSSSKGDIRNEENRLDARMIAIMGLLIALMVTLSRLVSIETPFVKISVTFIPQMIMGILFGPFWSGIGVY